MNQRWIYGYANDILKISDVTVDCSSYDGNEGSTNLILSQGVQTNNGGQYGSVYLSNVNIYDCVGSSKFIYVRWDEEVKLKNINVGLRNNIINYLDNDEIDLPLIYVRDVDTFTIENLYIEDYYTTYTITNDRNSLAQFSNITMENVHGGPFFYWYIATTTYLDEFRINGNGKVITSNVLRVVHPGNVWVRNGVFENFNILSTTG